MATGREVKHPALAALIQRRMKELGLTSVDFGRKLTGKKDHPNPTAAIHIYVNGLGAPLPKTAARMATILEVPVAKIREAIGRPLGRNPPRDTSPVAQALKVAAKANVIVAPPASRPPAPVFSFVIGEDGTAQIGLKMTLPVDNALRLMGALRELGVFGETGQKERP
jgi:hypothetical protein